jgi:hypothetical protein
MGAYPVAWSDVAKQLLGKRDRYTDALIRKEFKPVPSDAILIGQRRYVTSVADNRYAVVWDLDPGSVANVRAVVPTQLRSKNPDDVRKQVNDVLRYELNGEVTLD